ncbi:MAG TPA: DNA methyltransferase [Candidatus Glassbacteria bacterium]|nr:DNA methyltransferase [Candidatus Glassbacteria bacterium]
MSRDLDVFLSEISKTPWKNGIFAKQNWGIWLHRMSPFVGRIKPSFAHWLIRICTSKDDTILDPFCGVGTIILEANLLGRKVIGNDLNPYAFQISKAKFDRRGLENELKFLQSSEIEKHKISLKNVPDWIKEYYHPETLREILAWKKLLVSKRRDFLLGCLLGIIHGHRPQHLSIRTGYIIPYIPKPKPKKEYREVRNRMLRKVTRMYKDKFPINHNAKILNQDTRNLRLKDKFVDVIISSPPYYHTLDYVHANRVRLWFCGLNEHQQENLRNKLIQQRNTYLKNMKVVGHKLKRILKDNGIIIFILGDVHTGKKTINTAEDIGHLFNEIGFVVHGIVRDEIPASRTTIVKFGGEDAIQRKRRKNDRILIMSKR